MATTLSEAHTAYTTVLPNHEDRKRHTVDARRNDPPREARLAAASLGECAAEVERLRAALKQAVHERDTLRAQLSNPQSTEAQEA